MSDTDFLERDAFVCPACGNPYPRFLFAGRDEEGVPLDGPVMAWTGAGEPARVSEGYGWAAETRDLEDDEVEASREANPDGILYCGGCDHYFHEPAPADGS